MTTKTSWTPFREHIFDPQSTLTEQTLPDAAQRIGILGRHRRHQSSFKRGDLQLKEFFLREQDEKGHHTSFGGQNRLVP